MFENTCPKCNAAPNNPCTLPNGGNSAPHGIRDPRTIGGRYHNVLSSLENLTKAQGQATAWEIAEVMGQPKQYNNISGALRELSELGYLTITGKSGGRILYAANT